MPVKKVISLLQFIFACTIVWAQGPNSTGTYYEAANGKSGEALKTAFFYIINGEYNGDQFQQIKYGSGKLDGIWGAFATTDVLDDGVTIRDRYSNITHYIVGEDQQSTGGTNSCEGGTTDKHVYSREHSMPKSWFGGGTDVGPSTDLFHLYPVDSYMNSVRNNHPFGENDGEKFTSSGGYSKLGLCTFEGYTGTCFEPNDEWKGDFARTYFYMVTCYESSLPSWYENNADAYEGCNATFDGNTYPGLSSWQLTMMLNWSRQDPVDSIETARNEAVCAIQHNRNPFIDYPGLEEFIWGNDVQLAFVYDGYALPDTIVPVDTTATEQPDTIYLPAKKYQFRKVLRVINGKRYIIVTDVDGTLRMAQPLAGNYGYIQAEDASATNDIITLDNDKNSFTLLANGDGYNIKDSRNRYVFQTQSYDSFNVNTELPDEGALWTVEANNVDSTFVVTNIDKQKYVQYSTQFSSYGCYTNKRGLLPSLYEEVETLVGDVNRDSRIDVADVTALVNLFTDKSLRETDCFNLHAADTNEDGVITKSDIQSLINIVLNK